MMSTHSIVEHRQEYFIGMNYTLNEACDLIYDTDLFATWAPFY